ncbi:hypothetical protein [Rhodobacteraceae phage LS06-2018-MD06]|nr:hypothetical protein [Rhodobacteraceae phage LS06-2018-MD06]
MKCNIALTSFLNITGFAEVSSPLTHSRQGSYGLSS